MSLISMAMAICLGLLIHAVNARPVTNSSLHNSGLTGNGGPKADEQCEKSFIQVSQAPSGALPSGTPAYSVQILNECPSDCQIAQIVLSCGQFKSEKIIPSSTFTRVGDNHCLVNNGHPIKAGDVVAFQYANTQQFPLEVSTLQCLP